MYMCVDTHVYEAYCVAVIRFDTPSASCFTGFECFQVWVGRVVFTPYRPPPRKVDAAVERPGRVMKRAKAAEQVFRMALEEAEVWKQVHARAKNRLVAVGGLTRARGRKALGVGEYAAA